MVDDILIPEYQRTPNRLIQQGENELQAGEFFTAQKYFTEAISIDNYCFLAYYRLAIAYFLAGDVKEAILTVKNALIKDSSNPYAYVILGNLYYFSYLYPFAEDSYKEALEINKMFPEAHYCLARLYEVINEESEAEKHYRETVKLDENFAEAWTALGLLYKKQGKMDKANIYMGQAIKPCSKFVDDQFYIGVVYELQGYDFDSFEKYRNCIIKYPTYIDAYLHYRPNISN